MNLKWRSNLQKQKIHKGTVTEAHNLTTAVAKEDPQAFVIVSPAQEILGRGFNPLEDK